MLSHSGYTYTEVHLLHEPAYIICVGNLTEEKFCEICLNFPPECEYWKYAENKIYDDVTIYITDEEAVSFPK
jgi:hypothetical protein